MASPETKSFLRQSRSRMLSLHRGNARSTEPEIDIRVSPTKRSHSPMKLLADLQLDNYITVRVESGTREFLIPRQVAICCGVIHRMLERPFTFIENISQQITLPTINGDVMEKIFQFCFNDYIINHHIQPVHSSLYPNPPWETPPFAHQLPFTQGDVLCHPEHTVDNCVDLMSAFAFDKMNEVPTGARQHTSNSKLEEMQLSSWEFKSPVQPGNHPNESRFNGPKSNDTKSAGPLSPIKQQIYSCGQRIVFSVELHPDEVMDVMLAAHYLDVPALFDICCKMIATHIDDVNSFDGIPPDALEYILSLLSAAKLAEVEQSENFLSYHLPIDTSPLWKKALEKKGWDKAASFIDPAWQIELDAADQAVSRALAHLGVSTQNQNTQSEPSFYKIKYLQNEIQQRMNKFLPSRDSVDDLKHFLQISANWIHEISISQNFLELSGLNPITLIDLLPKLERLDLSSTQWDEYSFINFVEYLSSRKFLRLKTLILRNCGLDDRLAAMLFDHIKHAHTQTSHLIDQTVDHESTGILELDLSENKLTADSLLNIADLLKLNVPLQKLSVHDNAIASYFKYPFNSDFDLDNETSLKDQVDPVGPLFNSLAHNTNLRVLDLSFNSLNFCHVNKNTSPENNSIDVWRDFSTNKTLQVIILDDNPLVRDAYSSQQFDQFVHSLPSSLWCLRLDRTNIDVDNIVSICDALRTQTHITHLSLAGNQLGRKSGQALGRLLCECKSLEYVDLGSNNLLDQGAREFAEELSSRQKALCSSQIKCLVLDRNNIGKAALDIAQALKLSDNNQGHSIRYLNLANNRIPGMQLEQIVDIFADKPFELVL